MDRVQAHLKRQPGINDVRLLGWDAKSKTARWIVYLQPEARANLARYLKTTPELDLEIREEKKGSIKTRSD